jgi:phage terminase Nu1 subunit (DNA packaging protein)
MRIDNTEAISRKALCDVLGITSNSFQKLKDAGVFNALDRGVYDLKAAVAAWLKYHVDGAAPGDLTEARRLLTIAQRKQVELNTRRAERELVPLADAEQAFQAAMVMIAAQLDGLPGRVAGELAGIDDPAAVRAYLFDETRRIRDAAATTLEDWATGAGGGSGPETATPEDGGPVGG